MIKVCFCSVVYVQSIVSRGNRGLACDAVPGGTACKVCLFVAGSENIFVTGALDQWTEVHFAFYVGSLSRNTKGKDNAAFTIYRLI